MRRKWRVSYLSFESWSRPQVRKADRPSELMRGVLQGDGCPRRRLRHNKNYSSCAPGLVVPSRGMRCSVSSQVSQPSAFTSILSKAMNS